MSQVNLNALNSKRVARKPFQPLTSSEVLRRRQSGKTIQELRSKIDIEREAKLEAENRESLLKAEIERMKVLLNQQKVEQSGSSQSR